MTAGSSPRASTALPPPPEPLPAECFDSHTHLDLIERPVPEILADAHAAGITRLVTIGVDLTKMNTVGDLQGGIEEAERLLGFRVTRVSDEDG